MAATGASARIVVMGVLNTTPDSFSDGGQYLAKEAAAERVDQLLTEGAEIIDIGGESTWPGAEKVPAEEQIRRVGPALDHALTRDAIVSIDTTLPEVASYALERGAQIINDVSCLAEDELAEVAARHSAKLIIMHSRGDMSKMPGFSAYPQDGYQDVVLDVATEWKAARVRAVARGVPSADCWFDPGIGFAKNARHSFELLSRLDELAELGTLVVGPSRKSFIAALDGAAPSQRLGGTVAACLEAAARGARVLRVHDVLAIRQALGVRHAIAHGTMEEESLRA